MKIILLGIQGSGKSTQGTLLHKKLGVPYLSTGHIFRVIAKERTSLGRYIKEIMNAGYLIPDDKTMEIVSGYLKRPEYNNGYILDGFPRTVAQAESFKDGVDMVIHLKVSDRDALWRLSYRENDDNREDETLTAIRKRIEIYHKFTDPVLDYYKKKKLLFEVNGEQSIKEIHEEIVERLELKSGKNLSLQRKPKKSILAVVGMPGAGKSETAAYLKEHGVPFVRFGDITDEEVKKAGLPLNPENERKAREKLRKEFGMAAYAIKSKPRIDEALKEHDVIVLDGLYSWEEYVLLKEDFPQLTLVHVYAEPRIRYQRLEKRKIRPLTPEEARKRDVLELEHLNKGGPIAIADYLIENNNDNRDSLYSQVDILLARLNLEYHD